MSKFEEIKDKESGEETINLQVFYDVRDLTGHVSGNDLHEMFNEMTGEPSPSGNESVDLEKIKETKLGEEFLAELNAPLSEKFDDIINGLEKDDRETFGKTLKEQFEGRINEPLKEVASELVEKIKNYYSQK